MTTLQRSPTTARPGDAAGTVSVSGRLTLIAYVGLAGALTIAYFSLPGQHMALWAWLGLSSAAAIVVGIRRNRPERSLPWYLLAAAVLTFTAGDLTYNLLTLVLHQNNPFPSVADGFYLAMYPLLPAALALFIRSRTQSADRSSLIDALIISTGLGLLSWTYLIQPFVMSDELTWLQKVVSVAYPLGDVLLLAMVARLLSDGGFRCRSLQLLTFAALGLLTADVLYGLIQLNGEWAVGGPVDAGWVLFYVLLGAAALHPSMVQMTRPLPPKPVRIGRARLLLIAVVSLVAPVDAIVQVALGHGQASIVHSVFSAVIFVLVFLRMSGVVHAHRQGLEREKTLRSVGAALVGAGNEKQVAEAVRTALIRLGSNQPALGVSIAILEGSELRRIETGARAPLAALGAEAVRALSGFSPAVVEEEKSLAVLLPGPRTTGSTALVLPLRSVDELIGAMVVFGDARQLTLMQDALEALGFKAALALQRIALAHEINRRASEAHFRSLIQNASDVILVVGDDNTITYQTPSVVTVLGYELSDLAGGALDRLVHPDDLARSLATLDRMRQPGSDRGIQADWRLRCADGRWIDAEVVCGNLLEDADVRGLVLTIRDVTERRELEAELRHRAFHDSLTSLANRGLLADRLEHAMRRAARLNELVVVLFIDLDDFKVINDTRGHAVGDEVLQRVAAILDRSVRPGDTAARLGGDEFALLVEEAGSMAEGEALAARVLSELQEPMELTGGSLFVRASIGIASSAQTTTTRATDASELLQLADLALYDAKTSSKGGYRVFREALRTDVVDRMERQHRLQEALDCGQFRIAYQPIVDLASAKLLGVEALVRWDDPGRGVVAPDQFIPDAEESGLIVPLGAWVMHQAIRQAHEWQQASPEQQGFRVNINVSARQFLEPGFVRLVSQLLAEYPLTRRTLVLELTESMLIEDDGVAGILREISELGVVFALDDFGTGYSALGYLRRFPIDILKLDKTFIDDLVDSSDSSALVEAIIHLAETLELDLIVEGIEEAEQSRKLLTMGCHFGQGFLFGRASSPADIEQMFQDQDQDQLGGSVTRIPTAYTRPEPRDASDLEDVRVWRA